MQHAPSGTLVQAVRAHGGEVTCLDVRGARLVSGGGDRALRWWRWEAGAGWQGVGEARAAHRYGVVCVRWAPAGALLASGGVDGCVRVWGGGVARRALAAPGAPAVRALCWAGSARLLAGHDDGALLAWAPARGELLARLAAHEGALHALCTPAAGALLLSACTHGVLKVYDLAEVLSGAGSPAPLQWVDGAHDLGALCADAGADGAATGGHDAVVRVWAAAGSGRGARLRPAASLRGHAAAVTALRWGGALLASASLDRTARLWTPSAGACLLAVPAHPRYLTAVYLAPDARYMITGSNDKSFRMWSLGELTLQDEVETPCVALEHFALGDLEGIGPVEEEEAEGEEARDEEEGAEAEGARRVWSAVVHAGAINCVATCGALLATAASDGCVRVWRWEEEGGELHALHELGAAQYPALAASFGAGGGVLLSAGLDGGAALWDVASGVLVRELVPPRGGGEAGGGGVRGARLSPHRAPLALLATDDGLALLWRLADTDPHPLHVYSGHAEAVTCCAWSADGRVAATGAASGELRVYAPPEPGALHHEAGAHDLGVLSCDFAPSTPDIQLEEGEHLLATGGSDALVKLWRVEAGGAAVLLLTAAAHGGAVAGVRWGGALLATAGADRWARVWHVVLGPGGARMLPFAAVPVQGAGGAPAAALLPAARLLAVGALAGELALWRLEEEERAPLDDGAAPRYWRAHDVALWLRDAVLDAPGCALDEARAAELEAHVLAAGLTGARLLDDPIPDLLDLFGFDCAYDDVFDIIVNEAKEQVGAVEDADGGEDAGVEENAEAAEDALGEDSVKAVAVSAEGAAVRAERVAREMLREELVWLRLPPCPPAVEALAPHALRCPVSHALLERPVRAADGFSYSRSNLCEWMAAHGPRSPVSGRRLATAALHTNYRLRDQLRAFLTHHGIAPATG